MFASLAQTKHWLKTSEHPAVKRLYLGLKTVTAAELPNIGAINRPLYALVTGLQRLLSTLTRIIIWTPAFKGRLQQCGKRLNLYGGMPFVSGPVKISLGDDCRVSGATTFSGRVCSPQPPQLIVGSNIDIGWQTTIAVGSKVVLEDNVRIAGRAFLCGYPGHPLDAEDRAKHLPELEHQVGDIILRKDVWLATGVSVMPGVEIGEGTIVAADSVVCHSLPAGVIAAGVPAKVVRSITPDTESQS